MAYRRVAEPMTRSQRRLEDGVPGDSDARLRHPYASNQLHRDAQIGRWGRHLLMRLRRKSSGHAIAHRVGGDSRTAGCTDRIG